MNNFFSNKRFFIMCLAGGFLISFLLGLISKSGILNILIKSIVSSLVIGAFGFGFDVFLISTIGEEEYLKLFSNNIKTPKEPEKNIDIKEEIAEDEKLDYSEILKQPEEDVFSNASTPSPAEEKKYDFSSFVSNQSEQTSLPEVKEPETKQKPPSYSYDGEVSFQVKNKKINTTPEVVAKAIKTILQRDGD
ncbi:MAG: hypothetical protein N2258_00110 [Brevinematales bacterium]|nr:hypothetical protein [Brevinematales bacterium]